MNAFPALGFSLLGVLGVSVVNSAFGAPGVTHLFPAGGQRGTTVEVTAAGSFDTWPVGVWASRPGVTAVAGKEKGKLAVTVAADAVPGVVWLRLHDATGASGPRPFVVGTLPEVTESEPNDEPGKGQAVSRSAVVNGRLGKPGDVDCFAVDAKRGQTLVAAVEANSPLGSPMDAVVQVLSADGFVLAQENDGRGLDPVLAFPVPADGRYVVRVFAFPATPDSSIRFAGADTFVYRLTLTTGGYVESARPLAVERSGTVELVGPNLAGRRAEVRPDGVAFHPDAAGVAAVRVEPHPCVELPAPPTAPPFTATGRLDKPGEAGRATFVGAKGKPLAIQVESRSLGLPLTPVLRVLGPDGAVLAKAEPKAINADAELTFAPPADGRYTAEVRDLHAGGGPRFAYRLRVVPAEPDFELTVAADRFAATPGTPLDVPVTVVPRNGFAGEVTVTAEGLPAGVTAAPATGAKTVTLKLAAAGPAGGAFRIVGTAKGRPARPATAKLAEFETTTADLWLTAAAGAKAAAPPAKKK
jgi:hypothetical protein